PARPIPRLGPASLLDMRTAHGAYASNLSNVARNVLWVALVCSILLGPPLAAAQGEGLAGEDAASAAQPDAPFPPAPRTPQINVEKKPVISGLRIEAEEDPHGEPLFLGYTKRGMSIVRPGHIVDVFLFGFWLDEVKEIAFTSAQNCTPETVDEIRHDVTEFSLAVDKLIHVSIKFPVASSFYRLCVRQKESMNWAEVSDNRAMVSTETPPKQYYFPFWIQVVIITILLTLSGLFSGLNLGLMALSPQELILIQKSGSKTERKYADTIIPVREKGNLLLCSLLIGNVMVNSGISILLDDLTGSGYMALIASSAGIVVFGEIFPQSLCVKKGLAVGARTIWLTRFFMVLTWPIAYPISKLLDCILGDEVVAYDRKRLMELIKMSTAEDGLVAEELKIAVGAMEISDKTVGDVMTKIDDVFMLPDTTTLNTKTVAEILRMGYTRIPVFSGDRNNVVSLLFVKDLALLDPDDNFTIQTVCNYHQHALRFVLHDTPLRVMLEEFKKGDYHLAMVNAIVENEDQDPSYQLQGVVTLEDIVEEILQAEIVDETDAVMDNVSKMRRKAARGHELSMMLDTEEPQRVISVQMQLVTMQWLTTNISAFHQEIIDRGVLEKLIRQHVRRVELTHLPEFDKRTAIPRIAKLYSKQEYSERFILILEGRALVTIGQDSMTFEAGPWHSFGQEMLQRLAETNTGAGASITHSRGSLSAGDVSGGGGQQASSRKSGFVPDFSVTVLDDCTFLEVSCSSWLRAFKSTALSRGAPTRHLQDDFALKRQGPLSSSQHSLVEAPSSNGVKRHTSYITPQHDSIRRVKRTACDESKPRSASESEHVELLSSSIRIPLIDDSARSEKESQA
ncbi:hypothetical protein PMAYCL1PPCAC_01792, partial [Pristionchus mayeri]